jgi:S1/P1 Nuclease
MRPLNRQSSRKYIVHIRQIALTFCAALVAAFACQPALAWGRDGHMIVAEVATRHLSPNAYKSISRLLGGNPQIAMANASNWVDDIREQYREQRVWHFVNIPLGSNGFDRARDCFDDNCVVAQIERDKLLIADSSVPPEQRVIALKYLIHFVGDLHQPLHVSDNGDKGGNLVHVRYQDKITSLRAMWDDVCIKERHIEIRTMAVSKSYPRPLDDIVTGSVVDWANEGFLIAKKSIYSPSMKSSPDTITSLPPTYCAQQITLIAQQLQKAGVRLAYILNDTFR